MNINSIFTKMSFIFVVSTLLFLGAFIGHYQHVRTMLIETKTEEYRKIAKVGHKNRFSPEEVREYLKSLDFELVKKEGLIERGSKPDSEGRGFKLFRINGNFYIKLHSPFFNYLFKDNNKAEIEYYGFFIIGVVFILFQLSFFWIFQALRPLKDLKKQINNFSQGEEISCKSQKKDEIAQVANEFDKAAKKISLLLESRQLFLRTVMHELKTPIAKGKIVSELINDEKQKKRMSTIFDKLNYLINDFAKVEEIISNNYSLKKHNIPLEMAIENAIDMMMLEKSTEKIKVSIEERKKLFIDLDLFSMAIKNLIDNALNYSNDKKILIAQEENELLFISKGKKLEKDLEEYFKPFHNDTKDKNHGMGLGLYIVYSIVKLHGMELRYLYEGDKNIFKISM